VRSKTPFDMNSSHLYEADFIYSQLSEDDFGKELSKDFIKLSEFFMTSDKEHKKVMLEKESGYSIV
jgi:hypothetical protein